MSETSIGEAGKHQADGPGPTSDGDGHPATHGPGLRFDRVFSREGIHPFDEITWERRTAQIKDEKGKVVFEQEDVEVPSSWSQLATNIVFDKYAYGRLGTPERELSVRQIVGRVSGTMTAFGDRRGYFASDRDREVFRDELDWLLVNQHGAFNSPVWFNVGCRPGTGYAWDFEMGDVARAIDLTARGDVRYTGSACYIVGVADSIGPVDDPDAVGSISRNVAVEMNVFKFGSGVGSNRSKLRSFREPVTGGGRASGPVSFMRVYDAVAAVTRSGGVTRRAAKLEVLDAEHPDILEFIRCKSLEETKARALIEAGYEANYNGEAYGTVLYQNSNMSVRASDSFLRAVEAGEDWQTLSVVTGRPKAADGTPMPRYKAGDLMDAIAEGTWQCGDPGLLYGDAMERSNTIPNAGPIVSANPCVTGDTLVSTAEGYRRIRDLVGSEAILVDRNGIRRPVDRVFPTGSKPVYRLTTRAGYQVRLTADHRVLTANRGDIPACELTKDDRVVLNPVGFGTDDLDIGIAEAVGLMLGDGSISRKAGVSNVTSVVLTMGSTDDGFIVDQVRERINKLKFIVPIGPRSSTLGAWSSALGDQGGGIATVKRLSMSSKPVAALFEQYAILDEGSAGKRLTDAAFNLSRPATAGLLRGLYTADGCVYNYGAKSQSISLDSVSIDLLRQVQLILLGFGIKSKLYVNRKVGPLVSLLPDGKGGTKEYTVQQIHSLRISRSSRVRFESEIGFWPGSRKQARLELVNRSVGAYLDRMDDPVATLDPDGVEVVYDLAEPATHHFGANGIVVHNCIEYQSIVDSSCNLASLNLMKFRREDGVFDVERYRAAVRVFTVAQDILVDLGSYPTPEIARNAHRYRQLGPGYANLGALIMASGKPYDSDEGRSLAASVTSILNGQAYLASAEIAEVLGPFDGFEANRQPMLCVMEMHHAAAIEARKAAHVLFDKTDDTYRLWLEADRLWERTIAEGRRLGYRNSECSCIAPTGTIGFMMDCDTLGVEPELALVRYKNLWGRGQLKLVNRTVPMALETLGYSDAMIKGIVYCIDKTDTIEACAHLNPEHLPVFDCAIPPANGSRSIHWRGHVKMLAAIQPHLAMCSSKTINMPRTATVADIRNAYLEGWKLGLKALAIYRDGSKESQPVSTSRGGDDVDAKSGRDDGWVRIGLPGVGPAGAGSQSRVNFAEHRPSVTDGDRPLREVASAGGAVGVTGSNDPGIGESPLGGGNRDPQISGLVAGHPDRDRSGSGAVEVHHLTPRRERLPDTRTGTTHKLTVGGVKAYLTANTYPDGRLGEIFVEVAKQGSTVGGLMDAFATMVSIALQYGVPPVVIAGKFAAGSFPPSGITRNPDIPFASSLIDYVARWIGMEFVPGYREQHAPRRDGGPAPPVSPISAHAPTCTNCGGLCVQGGTCWYCTNCGEGQGGCG